jgi:hypothetical protein
VVLLEGDLARREQQRERLWAVLQGRWQVARLEQKHVGDLESFTCRLLFTYGLDHCASAFKYAAFFLGTAGQRSRDRDTYCCKLRHNLLHRPTQEETGLSTQKYPGGISFAARIPHPLKFGNCTNAA